MGSYPNPSIPLFSFRISPLQTPSNKCCFPFKFKTIAVLNWAFLFVLFSSLCVVTGKKFSIYNNNEIYIGGCCGYGVKEMKNLIDKLKK